MVYVVKENGTILFRVDAWESDCIEQAGMWISDNGYRFLDSKITLNGDMLMIVK